MNVHSYSNVRFPYPSSSRRRRRTAPSNSTLVQALLPGPLKFSDGIARTHSFSKDVRQQRRYCQKLVSATLTGLNEAGMQRERESTATERLANIGNKIEAETDLRSRTKLLLKYGTLLPPMPESQLTKESRVMGCTAQVWVTAKLGADGNVHFGAHSDSELTRGLCSILVESLSGSQPEEVINLQVSEIQGIIRSLGFFLQQPSRTNGLFSVFQAMQKKTRQLVHPEINSDPFPSLLISADKDVEAQGDFAIAQAQYLKPNSSKVEELASLLQEKKMGVVAHFYMDPEVQGVLVGVKERWPHVHISDSLVMADKALAMVEGGCERVAVLGVDFMAENVRAILARGGHPEVPVLRMSSDAIGCSLAEAAESDKYLSYLSEASGTPTSLHVIYINTSLDTKAQAHSLLPTITCTSSNVVQTVLQAFAQVPDLTLWYGPDTYMGGNLVEWMRQLAEMTDEEIRAVHPAHSRESVASMLGRLRYFHDGTCIVHDLFGEEVSRRVRESYPDAYLTAHFEVPGEMFSLAMEARRVGKGTVGSTQNILDFISARTSEALQRGFDDRLQFVLGTESGMVTAIVQEVNKLLSTARKEGHTGNVEVEVVFPVDRSAIATTEKESADSSAISPIRGLSVIPGVMEGEGCSISGGCASCPYMKMNSLDALLRVCQLVGTAGDSLLAGYSPRKFEHKVAGRTVADIGCDPILHMRHYQKNGALSDELVQDILSRHTV